MQQAIYAKMLDVVEKYTGVSDARKTAYKDALKKFRLPMITRMAKIMVKGMHILHGAEMEEPLKCNPFQIQIAL